MFTVDCLSHLQTQILYQIDYLYNICFRNVYYADILKCFLCLLRVFNMFDEFKKLLLFFSSLHLIVAHHYRAGLVILKCVLLRIVE